MTQRKSGFTLISKDAYVDRFLSANPSERRDDVVARLDDAIAAHKDGERCSCGEQIWKMARQWLDTLASPASRVKQHQILTMKSARHECKIATSSPLAAG